MAPLDLFMHSALIGAGGRRERGGVNMHKFVFCPTSFF